MGVSAEESLPAETHPPLTPPCIQGGGFSALIAAWTRASASLRGRPGGIGAPKRIVTTPGRLTKLRRGQTRPLSSATGTTGRPSAR